MNMYKVEAVESVRSMGIYRVDTEEEALDLFGTDYLKLDYATSPLDYLTSGWNPVARLVGES